MVDGATTPGTADEPGVAVRRQVDADARVYERLAPELTRFPTALVGRVDAPDVRHLARARARLREVRDD